MISVVVWKWHKPGYRSTFDASTVNTSHSMFKRKLRLPFRMICVTDDTAGINGSVECVDIRSLPSYEYMSVANPSNPNNPSCYVRLAIFHPKASQWFGDRIVSTDLDNVLTDDVTPLFDRPDDFVIWGGQTQALRGGRLYNWYNGSLMMLRAGARPQVFDDFDPRVSPARAHAAGCRGSDQGWIAHSLGHRESIWGTADGVYSYRVHVAPAGGRLPVGARFVAFHGVHDPWQATIRAKHSWVREHYR